MNEPPSQTPRREADESIVVREAVVDDVSEIMELIGPFVEQRSLLRRSEVEVRSLIKHGFTAVDGPLLVGFAAVEIYSRKLAEVQCLAVRGTHQRRGIGRRLIQRCVERAQELRVLEVMAITNSEEILRLCGFDYSLPNQKRAMFIRTREDED